MTRNLVVVVGLAALLQLAAADGPQTLEKLDFENSHKLTSSWIWPLAYPACERAPETSTVPAVALTRGRPLSIAVGLRNSSDQNLTGPLEAVVNIYSQGELVWSSTVRNPSFALPANGTSETTMHLGTLPDHIMRGVIEVNLWHHAERPQDIRYESTLFITLSDPNGAMQSGGSWIDVLMYGCQWAEGETTVTGAARQLTLGLFNSGLHVYTGMWAYARFGNSLDPGRVELKKYFDKVALVPTEGPVPLQCMDMAALLGYQLGAQGIEHDNIRVARDDDLSKAFVTNPIKAIGLSSFASAVWNWHQFNYVSSAGTSRTYDACLAMLTDLSGNAYGLPPMDFEPAKQSSTWDKGYWQVIQSLVPTPTIYGLVKSSHNQSPGPVGLDFVIQYTDVPIHGAAN